MIHLYRRMVLGASPRIRDAIGSSCCRCMMSTLRPPSGGDSSVQPCARSEKISKAMKAYLIEAKKAEEFMAEKRVEFEDGKRHLANMMGWDRDKVITQDDINVSEY